MRNDDSVPDWLAKAAREADAAIRPLMPIVGAAAQYIEEVRAAQRAAGSPLMSVALVLDASMAELIAAIRQQVAPRNALAYARVASAIATVSVPDVITVTERESVTVIPAAMDRRTFLILMVWMTTFALLAARGELPLEAQAVVEYWCAIISTAVTLVCVIPKRGPRP